MQQMFTWWAYCNEQQVWIPQGYYLWLCEDGGEQSKFNRSLLAQREEMALFF